MAAERVHLVLRLAGIALASLTFASLTAPSQATELVPGVYISDGGGGTLDIRVQTARARWPFRLTSVGGNGHICDLEGTIVNDRAMVEVGKDAEPCQVAFKAEQGAISVETSTPEACSNFCGARAYFVGTYSRPPPRCAPKARAEAQGRFDKLYRAKDYKGALAELTPILSACGNFLGLLESSQLRNDVAITQYHLGRFSDCGTTLAPVLEIAGDDEEELRDHLPPTDFDNFIPLARAAWYNAKLCAKRK